MADGTPDPRSAAPQQPRAPGSQITDVFVSAVLVFLQPVLLSATLMFLGVIGMGTVACGGAVCGDPAWLNRAFTLDLWGGGAIVAVTAAATLFRIVRQRLAVIVPMTGYLALIALGLICWLMKMQARPLGG